MSADVSVARRYAIVKKLEGQLQADSGEDESKSDSKVKKDEG